MSYTAENRVELLKTIRAKLELELPASFLIPNDTRHSDSRVTLAQYAISSIRYFFPEISIEECDEGIKELFVNKAVADFDEQSLSDMTYIDIDDSSQFLQNLADRPCLFAAFHSASYRCIARVLAHTGARYVIPVTADVYTKQRDHFYNVLAAHGASEDQLVLVNVEDRRSMLNVTRLLRRGHSLLMYVDGNSGLEGLRPSLNKHVSINFAGKTLLVRRGLFELHRLTGLPIVPVHSTFTEGFRPRLEVAQPIVAKDAQSLMQSLYDNFLSHLAKDPFIWEAWLYIYRFLPASSIDIKFGVNSIIWSDDDVLRFDHANYALLTPRADQLWIMNRIKFTAKSVGSEVMSDLIKSTSPKGIRSKDIKNVSRAAIDAFGCLLSNQI